MIDLADRWMPRAAEARKAQKLQKHRDLKELLRKIGAEDHAHYCKNDRVRIHSGSYEAVVYALLQAFGRLEPNFSPFQTIAMFHRYKKDKKLYRIYRGVMDIWAEWMDGELSRPGSS
jgi:hypothetical protein